MTETSLDVTLDVTIFVAPHRKMNDTIFYYVFMGRYPKPHLLEELKVSGKNGGCLSNTPFVSGTFSKSRNH